MKNILYVLAGILVIGWAIVFIGFNVGGIIHVLLALAIVAVILRIFSGSRFYKIEFFSNF